MVPNFSSTTLAKPVLACLLGAGSLWAGAQPAPYEGPLPTRMQFCQLELQGAEGEDRRPLLRECLLRRADAERLVARSCRRQVREAHAAPAERFRRQRDCEYRALAVHSSDLPHPSLAVAAPQAAAALGPAGPVSVAESPATR